MASPAQRAEEHVLCVLQLCRANVQTYCFGLAASMGAFLLTAGTKGKRYSMPNARIMIHQPLGGASGQVGPGFTQHSYHSVGHYATRWGCTVPGVHMHAALALTLPMRLQTHV